MWLEVGMLEEVIGFKASWVSRRYCVVGLVEDLQPYVFDWGDKNSIFNIYFITYNLIVRPSDPILPLNYYWELFPIKDSCLDLLGNWAGCIGLINVRINGLGHIEDKEV